MIDFSGFDGTGRKPRQQQKAVLTFLQLNWDKYNTFCINAPTAAGKSFIMRTIQRATNADLITINNQLVFQFVKEYPEVIPYIGRKHYIDEELLEHSRGLMFTKNRNMIFNPISYLTGTKGFVQGVEQEVVVLDEADQHVGLLLEAASTFIPVTQTEYDKHHATTSDFCKILEKRIQKNKLKLGKTPKDAKIIGEQIRYNNILSMIRADSACYTITKEQEETAEGKIIYKFKNTPIQIPTVFLRDLYRAKKVILLSGSLFPSDVFEVTGREAKDCAFFNISSPIDVEKRKIHYEPLEEELNAGFDVEAVAKELRDILERYPERPALIHTTYADADKLRLEMPECIYNTKENKAEKLKELAGSDKVMLGSGLFTGVDLKGDKCRLNIILKAQFPNLMDVWVKKKAAKNSYYMEYEVLRHLIQAAGRSTRTASDYSTTVICDPRLMRVITKMWKYLPEYFKEALVLGSEGKKMLEGVEDELQFE